MSVSLPPNMTYLGFQRIWPSPALRPYVVSFWVLERAQPLEPFSEEYIHPSGAFGIVFNFGDQVRLDGVPITEQVFLHGTNTYSRKMGFVGQVAQIGLKFYPGTAYPFLGVPLHLLANITSLQDVVPQRSLAVLYEELCELPMMPARVARIEAWLTERLTYGWSGSPLVSGSIQTLRQYAGEVSMGTLSDQLYISQRQLERLYQTHVGMTPKHYARLLRVARARDALKHVGNQSVADISTLFDYYDQSHFTNEFKAIVGMTPQRYMQRRREA